MFLLLSSSRFNSERSLHALFFLVLILLLAACSGGGDDDNGGGSDVYTIGGSVSGLTGTGLVLQNNGADDLEISADGDFTFTTAVADLSSFTVTVLTQPTSPNQTCVVTNETGDVNRMNVTTVTVSCTDFANLLVGTNNPDKILRFDETTGNYINDFVTESSGGLDDPLGAADLLFRHGASPGQV